MNKVRGQQTTNRRTANKINERQHSHAGKQRQNERSAGS